MWSIVSGCGVPLKNPMIIASFVSAIASSDRNISCRSKFSIQNCALFSGSPTARLKCQTAPSCTFTSIPLRNASSRGLYARMMRAFCAFVRPRHSTIDTVNHAGYELPAIRHEQRDGLSDLLGGDPAEYVSRWNYNLEQRVPVGAHGFFQARRPRLAFTERPERVA